MKKNLILAAVVLLASLVSCKKATPEAPALNIEGQWELTSYSTKAVNFGSEPVSVYLVFEEKDFTVYQQIGAGRYRKYTGTYELADGKLQGTYKSGKSLSAEYAVARDGDKLTLSTEKETYGYTSKDVPELVLTEAVNGE